MLLVQFIQLTTTVLTWLVIIHVVLSYFMSPYHPVRQTISSIVGPLLDPIRRIMPQTGMIDFSPIVLIILLQVISVILTQLILSL